MEIVSGIAMFSGPLVGGIFYILGEKTFIGGYAMPFYFIALTYILIIPLVIFVLKTDVKYIFIN